MADGRSGGSARGSDDPSEGHESIEDRLRALHDHLAATAERPVETDASRWLGEAEAVAADVAAGDVPRSAVATRVDQVRDLLSHVDGTGDPAADQHVRVARELAEGLASAIAEDPGDEP